MAKYYIDLNGIYEDIVDNWNECENIRKNKKLKVNFKSFKTYDEAKEALNNIKSGGVNAASSIISKTNPTKKSATSNNGIIEFYEYDMKEGDYLIFTDGGCDRNQAGAPVSDYGYSAVVTKVVDGKLIVQDILGGIISYNSAKALKSETDTSKLHQYNDAVRQANITGELHAARLAYSYCVSKRIAKFYIVCDYMGVGYFCTGYYKNNLQPQSKSFKEYFDMLVGDEGPIDEISFIHTPSHVIGMNPEAQKYRKLVANASAVNRVNYIFKNAELLAGNYNADDVASVLKSGQFELAEAVTETVDEVVEFYKKDSFEAVNYRKYILTNAFVYTNLEDIPHGQSGFYVDYHV